MAIQLKPVRDQVIVITGASSGIGLATAHAAAKRGARVVLAARSDEALNDIVSSLNNGGQEALAVHCDVSKQEDVEQLAETVVSKFGRIDSWVNNAGLAIFARLDESSDEDNRRLFDINYWGVVYGSLAALPHLKKQGGALINVGSEVSDAAAPLLGQYVASKHAVKGFTDVLRIEVEIVDKLPVAVTLIQPTAVDTPFPQHARNYMQNEPSLPTPMIDPEKVADAILSAAEKHTRDIKVGFMAKVNTTASKLMPGMADKMSAKQIDKLQSDEPPRDPAGTLRKPGNAATTHGNAPPSKA